MRWETWGRQTHPDDGKLLLHLEGELKGRESETLSRHIQACWQCRARSERLHRSICAFARAFSNPIPHNARSKPHGRASPVLMQSPVR